MNKMIDRTTIDSPFSAKLIELTKSPISKNEQFAQKVSFVFGTLPPKSNMTKEQVTKMLENHA